MSGIEPVTYFVLNGFDRSLGTICQMCDISQSISFGKGHKCTMGLHQHKVAPLVPDDSLLCSIHHNFFLVIRNTCHFSSGMSNAI